MKKLFYIYTNPKFMTALYQPVMERAFGRDPELQIYFLCDNSILADSLKNDLTADRNIETRLERLIDNCIDAGADCIVVGCTVMNEAAGKLQAAKQVPVISTDAPMIRKIKEDGITKIAVLSHALDNARTIERQLDKQGIESDLVIVDGAAEANKTGDFDLLARLYQGKVTEIADRYDAIALGHISADDVVFDQYGGVVYRSGSLCVDAVRAALDMRGI